MYPFKSIVLHTVRLFVLLALLGGLLAMPVSVWAATITNQRATNNAVNLYYRFSYVGAGLTHFRVYIDTDMNRATGFAKYGIGADYLIEGNLLYRHVGNNSSWTWAKLRAVAYSKSASAVSWTVARSAVGETANPNSAKLIFQVENYTTKAITSTGIYTHIYSPSVTATPFVTTPIPTATYTTIPVTPTYPATPTNIPFIPTSTPTATYTKTFVPPTATATRTNTPLAPTSTPTATYTKTLVPPTVTATRTNTPVVPTFTPTPTTVKLQVLLPLYIYPNSSWNDIASISSQYASTVSTTIIIDPPINGNISGPPDLGYQQGIANLRANPSIKIIGYVYTSWGSRSINQVESNIDAYYYNSWQVNGFFIDQTASDPGNLAYYTQLYNYIKSLNPNYIVILNPGTTVNEGYISSPAGDVATIYESTYNSWPAYQTDTYVKNYPAKRFAMLAYNVGIGNVQSSLELARARNISYVWVTDDVFVNPLLDSPWDLLPTYWQNEFNIISALNSQ